LAEGGDLGGVGEFECGAVGLWVFAVFYVYACEEGLGFGGERGVLGCEGAGFCGDWGWW